MEGYIRKKIKIQPLSGVMVLMESLFGLFLRLKSSLQLLS